MSLRNVCVRLMTFLTALMPTTAVRADPCGMVPPIWLGDGSPIERVGIQRTYVFFKDGVETIVLRPGFSGRVDEFGMLIPFPSPPELRKVADDVFGHLAAAIDPPEVLVDLRPRPALCRDAPMLRSSMKSLGYAQEAAREEVVVLRREALGMYEVAVLEAGSAAALSRWMNEHGFRYPTGMDATCEEYVAEGWCFVAVKARVGKGSAATPTPGMREVDTQLPAGATFDGHVQAMGFRFFTEELVVPMRLSTFNPGELHNVMYVLAEGPTRAANLPESFVVRQISGRELYRNVTDPLPLRVLGGDLSDLTQDHLRALAGQRDPFAKSGIARELFAADLLAARTRRLSHEHEDYEKELLEIGERLGLRGPELDALHARALAAQREAVVAAALSDLEGMTLTVIDADFPREVLAAENLTFSDYRMAAASNRSEQYDAKFEGPAPVLGGYLMGATPPGSHGGTALGALLLAGLLAGVFALHRRFRLHPVPIAAGALLLCGAVTGVARASSSAAVGLAESLLRDASASGPLTERGWALVALAELDVEHTRPGLERLARSADDALVRTWAAAALARTSDSADELLALTDLIPLLPASVRPVKRRWLELLSDPERELDLALALDACGQSSALQQELLPALLTRPTSDFVRAMLSAEADPARRLAAGALATLAARGRADVAASVLDGLRFRRSAAQVPWSDGALFVPGLPWTASDGRALVRSLIAWHLWCDGRELDLEQRQIDNNLSSWALANLLEFDMPGVPTTTESWLAIWRAIAGRRALAELLIEVI